MIIRCILLTSFLVQPAWACDVSHGTYEAITESEFSLTLEIFADGRYRFVHKNWLPGDLRHVGSDHIYKGIYECEGSSLTLRYTDIGQPVVGEYRNGSVNELHFPSNKESMLLDFTSASNPKSIVSGRLYWPRAFIDEVFR
jgi:hypothetical protein